MTHPPQDRAAIQRMWQAFRQSAGVDAELSDAFAFGDNPEMAHELADLVLRGPKRATAGLELAYERENEPVPRPGDHWVILDGRGQPVCVIRTTEVEIKPLNQVDAAFAWDEGEGDRSLAYWQEAHRRFFTRYCHQVGVQFSDDLPVVLQRFDLVWPPRPAGRA